MRLKVYSGYQVNIRLESEYDHLTHAAKVCALQNLADSLRGLADMLGMKDMSVGYDYDEDFRCSDCGELWPHNITLEPQCCQAAKDYYATLKEEGKT